MDGIELLDRLTRLSRNVNKADYNRFMKAAEVILDVIEKQVERDLICKRPEKCKKLPYCIAHGKPINTCPDKGKIIWHKTMTEVEGDKDGEGQRVE